MDSDNNLVIPKSDPVLQAMFSTCKPGDEIEITIGYQGKTATLGLAVGGDDENTLTATVGDVSSQDAGKDAETEGEESGEPPALGGAAETGEDESEPDEDDESSPAAYVSKMRKAKK